MTTLQDYRWLNISSAISLTILMLAAHHSISWALGAGILVTSGMALFGYIPTHRILIIRLILISIFYFGGVIGFLIYFYFTFSQLFVALHPKYLQIGYKQLLEYEARQKEGNQ